MESKILLRNTRCAECGKKMKVVIGTGEPGFYNLNIMNNIMRQYEPKGSYQCSKCKRYYCWACSDSRKTCKCGNQNWSEVMYIDSTINPNSWKSVSKKDTKLFKSSISNPWIILILGIFFYVVEIILFSSGRMAPSGKLKMTGFIFDCLPAIAIYWAIRKTLKVKCLIALLIASIGPIFVSFFWF